MRPEQQQAMLDRRLERLTDVKVPFRLLDAFMVKLGERGFALRKEALSWQDDMVPVARQVLPPPRHISRKGERAWADTTYAMLERYSCLREIVGDPRLTRWATASHRPGEPATLSPCLIAAASHATLVPVYETAGSRHRVRRYRFRVDEVVTICMALERLVVGEIEGEQV
jgi:hypothetical protein